MKLSSRGVASLIEVWRRDCHFDANPRESGEELKGPGLSTRVNQYLDLESIFNPMLHSPLLCNDDSVWIRDHGSFAWIYGYICLHPTWPFDYLGRAFQIPFSSNRFKYAFLPSDCSQGLAEQMRWTLSSIFWEMRLCKVQPACWSAENS